MDIISVIARSFIITMQPIGTLVKNVKDNWSITFFVQPRHFVHRFSLLGFKEMGFDQSGVLGQTQDPGQSSSAPTRQTRPDVRILIPKRVKVLRNTYIFFLFGKLYQTAHQWPICAHVDVMKKLTQGEI